MSKKSSRSNKRYYKIYYGKPKQLKARSSRNKARRILVAKFGKAACKDRDVDHIDHNPLNNKLSNLRLRNVHENRGDNLW